MVRCGVDRAPPLGARDNEGRAGGSVVPDRDVAAVVAYDLTDDGETRPAPPDAAERASSSRVKRSNTTSRCPAGMPAPSSATTSSTRGSSERRTATVRVACRTALSSRLRTTRRSCSGDPDTCAPETADASISIAPSAVSAISASTMSSRSTSRPPTTTTDPSARPGDRSTAHAPVRAADWNVSRYGRVGSGRARP